MNSLSWARMCADRCENSFQVAQAVQFVEHVQRQHQVDVVQVAQRANIAFKS